MSGTVVDSENKLVRKSYWLDLLDNSIVLLFTNGIGNPEAKKYSGNIIYVDNRPSITRSSTQKEDIKIILQF